MAPFRCCRGAAPVLSRRGKLGYCHHSPEAFFPFSPVCLPFPFLWFLNHAPFKKPIDFFLLLKKKKKKTSTYLFGYAES